MDINEKIFRLSKNNLPFVSATVVKTSGSTPGKIGFKILVEKDGSKTGTVGGGFLEKDVVNECLLRIKSQESGVKEYLLSEAGDAGDSKGGHGHETVVAPMICGGSVWIYFEAARAKIPAHIFGAGHVGTALCHFLAPMNYHITLLDNRTDMADKEQNRNVDEMIFSDYQTFCDSFDPPKDSFVVIMTHGHEHDYQILSSLYKKKHPLKYIGVIASRAKAAAMVKKLRDEMGRDLDISNLHTPIGLDIGGNSAAEIALAIAAEMQAVQYGRQSAHIGKNRKKPAPLSGILC